MWLSKENSQWAGFQPFGPSPLAEGRAIEDGPIPRATARMIRRIEDGRLIRERLGQVYRKTTVLPRPGKPDLGPARMPDGQVLKWGMWLPNHSALLDFFSKRTLPPPHELEARKAFARQHGLLYGYVEPTWSCTIEDVLAWVQSERKKEN